MKLLPLLMLVTGLSLPLVAPAQWQWVDKDGRKVFSDRAPPDDIPAKSIIKQPGQRTGPAAAAAAAANAASAASTASAAAKPASAASAPKVSGKDKELEDKKKQAEAQEAAKQKADEEKLAKDKAESCDRSRRNLAALNSGVRIRQPNAKGELEFMTDEARSAETKRLQDVIAAECKS